MFALWVGLIWFGLALLVARAIGTVAGGDDE